MKYSKRLGRSAESVKIASWIPDSFPTDSHTSQSLQSLAYQCRGNGSFTLLTALPGVARGHPRCGGRSRVDHRRFPGTGSAKTSNRVSLSRYRECEMGQR